MSNKNVFKPAALQCLRSQGIHISLSAAGHPIRVLHVYCHTEQIALPGRLHRGLPLPLQRLQKDWLQWFMNHAAYCFAFHQMKEDVEH